MGGEFGVVLSFCRFPRQQQLLVVSIRHYLTHRAAAAPSHALSISRLILRCTYAAHALG